MAAALRRCVKRGMELHGRRCALHCMSPTCPATRRSLSTARHDERNDDDASRAAPHQEHHQRKPTPWQEGKRDDASSGGYEGGSGDATAAEADRRHSFAQEFLKPRMDATFLVDNYTAPALAAAYQDRYGMCSLSVQET